MVQVGAAGSHDSWQRSLFFLRRRTSDEADQNKDVSFTGHELRIIQEDGNLCKFRNIIMSFSQIILQRVLTGFS